MIKYQNWPSFDIRIMSDNLGSIRIAERIDAVQDDVPSPSWFLGCLTFRITQKVAA